MIQRVRFFVIVIESIPRKVTFPVLKYYCSREKQDERNILCVVVTVRFLSVSGGTFPENLPRLLFNDSFQLKLEQMHQQGVDLQACFFGDQVDMHCA